MKNLLEYMKTMFIHDDLESLLKEYKENEFLRI